MTSQEKDMANIHEQLFKKLKKKNQEELIALLEQLVQRQPETETLLELLVELPLGEASVQAKQGLKCTVDPAAIRRQVDVAFEHAGTDWDAAGRAAVDLAHISAIGHDFARAGAWATAQMVYETLAEEILAQYDLYRDEGQLSWVLGECANGLLACLKAQADLPQDERLDEDEREMLLTSLLTLWHFGDQYGEITPDLAPTMVALASVPERTLLEAWVREKLQPGQDTSSQWRNRGLVGFLALLKQAQGSTQDEVLAEYRQAGLYAELAERYLQLGCQSEALAVAQEHLTETFEITRFAEHLLQSDAQWRDQALALIERRLTEAIAAAETTPKDHMRPHAIDTYRRWLSEQYRLAGHVQQAVVVEQARFQAHPDEATYRAVRGVAQADGQESKRWTELRAQLLQTLTQQRSWAALASIFVDEGEIKQALAALREAEQTLRVRTYGSGSSVLSTLRVRVAQAAEEGYPDEAVQIYARVVEELIALRGRENYQQAAAYLSQIRKLYQKMGREQAWETYLAGVRSNHKSLRAFKEELEKKGF